MKNIYKLSSAFAQFGAKLNELKFSDSEINEGVSEISGQATRLSEYILIDYVEIGIAQEIYESLVEKVNILILKAVIAQQ